MDLSRETKITKIDAYMQLAAAIVRSGRECGDRRFLQSEWCRELKEGVVDWANMRLKNGHSCGPASLFSSSAQ